MYMIKNQPTNKKPTPKLLKLLYFLLLPIWKEYPWVNLQSCWRKTCILLHTSWKSQAWWERSGSQSDLPLFCLRLWFDMTVDLVTIPHVFPPLWQLIHARVTLWSESRMALAEKWLGKKIHLIVFFSNTDGVIIVVHCTPGWRDNKKYWTDFIGN